jgi:hypothetical protein
LDETGLQRFWARRRSGARSDTRRVAGISERLLLSVGLVLFAAVAATSILLSVLS